MFASSCGWCLYVFFVHNIFRPLSLYNNQATKRMLTFSLGRWQSPLGYECPLTHQNGYFYIHGLSLFLILIPLLKQNTQQKTRPLDKLVLYTRCFILYFLPDPPPPQPKNASLVLRRQSSLHGAALVHAIMGNMSEASASLEQLRSIVEEDWARRRRRRGRTAAVTEGTSHASLIVMETLDAYLAAARVSNNGRGGGGRSRSVFFFFARGMNCCITHTAHGERGPTDLCVCVHEI